MVETLRDLPKGSPERNAVAEQLKRIRIFEREDQFTKNRGIAGYTAYLYGLGGYFDYVRQLGNFPKVLDIGAGTTRAAHELSGSKIGKGIDFMATVLVRPQKDNPQLPKEKVISTSAEVLKGIPDQSIAGVLACYSIAYSQNPYLAIRRIDQVLVKGGIIKARFAVDSDFTNIDNTIRGLRDGKEFIEELKNLEYDIAATDANQERRGVIVAIKPGGPGVSAKEVLNLDYESYLPQMRQLLNMDC